MPYLEICYDCCCWLGWEERQCMFINSCANGCCISYTSEAAASKWGKGLAHICPVAAPRDHHKEVTVLPKTAQRLEWLRATGKPVVVFFVCFQLLAPAPSKDRKYYFWSANISHVLPKNYIKLVLNFKMRH